MSALESRTQRGLDISPEIIEGISLRDKEVLLLAPIFFYAKYMRRNVNTEGFKLTIPEVDFSDPVSILRAGFDLQRQANSDISGDVVTAVSDILATHPLRAELFSHLTTDQIIDICTELNNIFENQEYCAQCESCSHYDGYDAEPEEFAIDTANEMLFLWGGHIGLLWFTNIREARNRQPIIEAVIMEKLQPYLLKMPNLLPSLFQLPHTS